MKKQIISIVLTLVIVASLLVTALPVGAAPATPSVTLKANTAKANPGNTITVTVTLGPTAGLSFFTFDLDIPAGLTYIDGSINSNAAAAMNYGDNLEIAKHGDGTPFIQGFQENAENYVSESSLDIATFRCKVDANANGTYNIKAKESDFGSADFSVLDARITTAAITVSPKLLATPKLSKVQNTAAGVSLEWGRISGAAKYRVFRKTGAGKWTKLADTAAVKLVDKTAKSGTQYAYTVRCLSKDGKTFTSNYDKTGKSILCLSQPKITKFENVAKGVKMAWSKVSGAASYKVYLKNGKKWNLVATVKSNSYTYIKVKSGTSYTYTVRAVSKDGKSLSAYNTKGWSQKFIAAPALPTLKNTKNGVQISISKVNGAVKYRIFRMTGSGKFAKLADTANLTYLDKTVKNGKSYTYTVRCITKDGKAYTSDYNTKGRSIKCKR